MPLVERSVYGDVLPHRVVCADDQRAELFGHLQVLRKTPQHGPLAHVAMGTQSRPGFDTGPGFQPAAFSNDYVRFDGAEWSDLNIPAEFSGRTH
jgi:hypothetical protein